MELLPCPACGATKPKLVEDYHDGTSQVRCRECWVQTRWTRDAATLWNIRVVAAKIETSKEVVVATECDICGNKALYDAKTKSGPWGYLCEACFQKHGVGLGLGKGQRLKEDTQDGDKASE